MRRISNSSVTVVFPMLLLSGISGALLGSPPSNKPEQMLASDLKYCGSSIASAASCKERLASDLKASVDKGHGPINRHIEALASAISNALVGGRLSSAGAAHLLARIVELLHSPDLSASTVAAKLQEAKSALNESGISEVNRNLVVGALRVICQDVRGPEDEGAQITPRMPPNFIK